MTEEIGPDFQYGYGRINARHGVEVIENDHFFLDTIAQGQTNTHTLTVPAGLSKLKVMVNWVDPQGFVGSARNLINDLNITLTAPDGNQLLPWVLDPTPNITAITSNAVRAIDSLNNVEQVTLDFPVAGTYTLSVNGSTIPFGSQEYFFSYHFVQDEIAVEFPAGENASLLFSPRSFAGPPRMVREPFSWNSLRMTDRTGSPSAPMSQPMSDTSAGPVRPICTPRIKRVSA